MMKNLLRTCLAALACAAGTAWAGPLPRPAHVVIVIEENHGYSEIIGNPDAPWINALAQHNMLFTRSFGVTHPSEPNYLALFSGSTHEVESDICPVRLSGHNLASALQARGLTFATYSEQQPASGSRVCASGDYRRKHNPAADWPALTPDLLPFSAFPADFSRLPAVSLVVPDLDHDMHDGTVAQGDAWLKAHLAAYAAWARTHDSLLIVTWDESFRGKDNRIATIFAGAMVRQGTSAQRINHYNVLRTLEEMYGLAHIGASADVQPITGVWRKRE